MSDYEELIIWILCRELLREVPVMFCGVGIIIWKSDN